MTVLPCEPTVSVPQNERLNVPAPTLQRRYFGLDGVRATAMLLGVFYHLPIAFMAGGFGMGFGFGGSPKTPIDNWLHSFRMPLFFLISGFFANMMLSKYGLRRYLTRRWWRIGAPLLMAFLLLVGLRIATEYFRANPLPGFGRPVTGMPGFGPPAGMPGFGAGPFGLPGAPGPGGPGTGGPGAGGASTAGTFGGGGGGRFGNFGPMPGGTVGGPGAGAPGGFGGPFGGPAPGGFGPPGGGPFSGGSFGPPVNEPAGPPAGGRAAGGPAPQLAPGAAPPAMMEMPSRSWSDALFGNQSRHLNLEHLWFLWYLLIFVTIGPLAVKLISLPLSQKALRVTDRTGYYLIRFNVLALIVGLLTLPALVHAHGFMGWSLANPIGFSAPFPDFLVQYYADEPYYFLYFLVGWWIFRQRDHLTDLARHWLWNFVMGIAGFALSQHLADLYALSTDDPYYAWVRIAGFAFYGIGAAYTACGFIGFFQLYLDRPTRLSRYFADTALWIYLAHLPLIPYLMWWVQPANSAWWNATLGGMVIVTGVSLVMFETLIRPTPLVYIFGPPNPKRANSQPGHATASAHP